MSNLSEQGFTLSQVRTEQKRSVKLMIFSAVVLLSVRHQIFLRPCFLVAKPHSTRKRLVFDLRAPNKILSKTVTIFQQSLKLLTKLAIRKACFIPQLIWSARTIK